MSIYKLFSKKWIKNELSRFKAWRENLHHLKVNRLECRCCSKLMNKKDSKNFRDKTGYLFQISEKYNIDYKDYQNIIKLLSCKRCINRKV